MTLSLQQHQAYYRCKDGSSHWQTMSWEISEPPQSKHQAYPMVTWRGQNHREAPFHNWHEVEQVHGLLAWYLLSPYLPLYLPSYLPTYLPSCLPSHLFIHCIPTLPTYLPTYLSIFWSVLIYLYTHLLIHSSTDVNDRTFRQLHQE